MPTIDAFFGDMFYPFSIIISAILPVPQAISFKMVFHIFLAGLFFFLLLRRGLKVSAPLAFVGGVFYMLNPQFLSLIYPGHDGKMFVIAWIPFLVWQIKEMAETRKFVHAILLGVGIGMSILTSQIQSTYFAMWGLAAYTAFAIVHALVRHEAGKAMRIGCFFVIACIVGLGIGFIQLYPSFSMSGMRSRSAAWIAVLITPSHGRCTGPSSSRSGFPSSATRSTTTGEATPSS